MRGKSRQGDRRYDARAQRLVVLQVAGALYGRQREQLQGALGGLSGWRVNKAIKGLETVGVVVVNGRTVRPSRALARMEQLGFIDV